MNLTINKFFLPKQKGKIIISSVVLTICVAAAALSFVLLVKPAKTPVGAYTASTSCGGSGEVPVGGKVCSDDKKQVLLCLGQHYLSPYGNCRNANCGCRSTYDCGCGFEDQGSQTSSTDTSECIPCDSIGTGNYCKTNDDPQMPSYKQCEAINGKACLGKTVLPCKSSSESTDKCIGMPSCPTLTSTVACTTPGTILNSLKKDDEAAYLQICGIDYQQHEAQCSLTALQKAGAACYALKSGLALNQVSSDINKIDTGADISINSYPYNIGNTQNTRFSIGVGGSTFTCCKNEFSDCQTDSRLILQSVDNAEQIVKSSLGWAQGSSSGVTGSSWDTIKLACCTTDDTCQSYGCDKNIIYDWTYGCTNIDFGKKYGTGAGVGKVANCDVCAKDTYGCGSGIVSAGYYKQCNPSEDNANIYCWSVDKKCNPFTSCEQDQAQGYCASFGCNGALTGSQTWTKDQGEAKCKTAPNLQNPDVIKTCGTKAYYPAQLQICVNNQIYCNGTNTYPNYKCENNVFNILVPNGSTCSYSSSADCSQAAPANQADCNTKKAACQKTSSITTACQEKYNECQNGKRAQCVKDSKGNTSWSFTANPCLSGYTCVGTVKPTSGNLAGKTFYAVCCDAATYDAAKNCYDEGGTVLKQALPQAPTTQTNKEKCEKSGGKCCDGDACTQCAYASGLQYCKGNRVDCKCEGFTTNGQPSCNVFPTNKQVCVGTNKYSTVKLSPVTNSNYCVYSSVEPGAPTVECPNCQPLTAKDSTDLWVKCDFKTSAPVSTAEKCEVPQVQSPGTCTWTGNKQATITVNAKVDSGDVLECRAGNGNTFDSLQYPMTQIGSGKYQVNISLSGIQSCFGDDSSQQSSYNNGNSTNSSNYSGNSGTIQAAFTVICRNTACQDQTKGDSSPITVNCGSVPSKNQEQQNQEKQNQENQNQNQTPLQISSCTAQASGSDTSAVVQVLAVTNGQADCTYSINGSGSHPMQSSSSQNYTDNVPASSLQAGSNSFTITCKAGSVSTSGSTSNSNTSQNTNTNTNNTSAGVYGTATCTASYTNNAASAPQITNCSGQLSGTGASAVLQIKAATANAAICSYSINTDKGSTAAGQQMQTTDNKNFIDNIQLSNLTSGNNVIYVRCKGLGTSGAENQNPCQIQYNNTVNAITISNPKPSGTVTSSPVTISVTTDVSATCRFSTTDQDYNSMPSANQFVQTSQGNNYLHQYQLAVENNKNYTYYVRCRDNNGNISGSLVQITFNTNVGSTGLLAITNPQPSGTVNSNQVTLSVQTSINATCKYTYNGSTVNFTSTGGVYHSSPLSLTGAGAQNIPVTCTSNTDANVTQSATISFVVAAGTTGCAQISDQDKKPDSALGNASSYNSTYDYVGDNTTNYNTDLSSNAQYMWQSMDSGIFGGFNGPLSWNAGYKFMAKTNGWITELCGFFDSKNTNAKVLLYDSNYRILASTPVVSNNNWNCVTINPVQVSANQHYYVIANIENGSMYYKNATNLYSGKENAYFKLEQGVRELIDEPFGTQISTYDYFIFGLVDARFATEMGSVGVNNQGAPKMTDPQPSGSINNNMPTLHIQTDSNAFCKFDRWDRTYENMNYVFGTTGGVVHEQKVCDLQNGVYTYFVRCQRNGVANTKSLRIIFTVQSSGQGGVEPQIFNPQPSGTISTNSVTLSVNTLAAVSAQCKFDTNDVSYNSMANAMTATVDPANSSNILNSAVVGNLNDGHYTYYVRCRDINGNTNTSSTAISFTISRSATNDANPPQISNVLASSTNVNIGSSVKITARVTDNQGVGGVTIYARNSAGQTVASLNFKDDGVNDDGIAGNGIFGNSWNTSGLNSGIYHIDITAVDTYGNAITQNNVLNITLN